MLILGYLLISWVNAEEILSLLGNGIINLIEQWFPNWCVVTHQHWPVSL